jgi:hypothetical protein
LRVASKAMGSLEFVQIRDFEVKTELFVAIWNTLRKCWIYKDLVMEKCTQEIWYLVQGYPEMKAPENLDSIMSTVSKELCLQCTIQFTTPADNFFLTCPHTSAEEL